MQTWRRSEEAFKVSEGARLGMSEVRRADREALQAAEASFADSHEIWTLEEMAFRVEEREWIVWFREFEDEEDAGFSNLTTKKMPV